MKKDEIVKKETSKKPKISIEKVDSKVKNMDLTLQEVSSRIENLEMKNDDLWDITNNMNKILERVRERLGI